MHFSRYIIHYKIGYKKDIKKRLHHFEDDISENINPKKNPKNSKTLGGDRFLVLVGQKTWQPHETGNPAKLATLSIFLRY